MDERWVYIISIVVGACGVIIAAIISAIGKKLRIRTIVLICLVGTVLGSRKKLNPPTYLSFFPCSVLRRRPHTTSMKPSTRLA